MVVDVIPRVRVERGETGHGVEFIIAMIYNSITSPT